MAKFKYFKVYPDLSSKEEDMKHLREVLPPDVDGKHFRDIPVLTLESDQEIDFEQYGSSGWEVDPE